MKIVRRLLALMLIASLCAGTISMTAFAEEADVKVQTIDNGDGTTTTLTTTTTAEVDEGTGNVTITVSIEQATQGTKDGVAVDYKETTTTVTTTDANGNQLGYSWVEDGSEKMKWTETDSGNGQQPKVETEIIPGQTTIGTASTTAVRGDTPSGENDNRYNYTTITTTDRTVSVDTSEIKTTVNDTATGLVGEQEVGLKGVDPVYDENDNAVKRNDGKIHDGYGKDGMFDRNYLTYDSKYTDTENWDMPDNAEFRYVGTGEHCIYYNARVTVTYKKDIAGNTIYDDAGNPVIESITKKDGTPITIDGEPATELIDKITLKPVYDDYNGGRPTTFMLMDKEGNKVYAYCCDMDTGAVKGAWYSVSNLEDSDYYASEEAEEHVRSIVMNGYWGTSDIPDENGDYERGSLESIKDKLRDAIKSGEMENEVIEVTVVDSNGNETVVTKDMLSLIDELTEGEALLATQSAIWSYSNGSVAIENGKDGVVVVDPDGYKWNHDPSNGSKTWTDSSGKKWDLGTLDDFGSARVDFMYKWLIALETEEESTVVINEKNFVDSMSIIVKDKVSDHKNNSDEDNTNDVYNSDLNFKLAFVPGEDDDLLVQITYKDLDGNDVTVVRRLAGENAEGQSYEDIKPEADGSYVLKGLKLSENKDFAFDLRLEGTQYLEDGVYLYQAVGGRDVSQTFVGIAEGTRNVDVSMGMTIKFDVDEDNHVVAERKWHSEGDPVWNYDDSEDPKGSEVENSEETEQSEQSEQSEEPVQEISDEETPLTEIPDEDVPLTNIPDEDVPLANVPQTGDMTLVWFGISALSGLGLAGVNRFGKKKDDEEE